MVFRNRRVRAVTPSIPPGVRLASLVREGRSRLGMRWNRLKVAAGATSGGFFIPYRYAGDLEPPATPYTAIAALFQARDAEFQAFVAAMARHLPAYQGFGADPRDPTWGRSMFPAFDGAAAYTLVRQVRPKRIVEIGSGNSTRFMARALRDGGIDCAFTCIDPAPRVPVEGLGVARIPRLLSETDAELCAGLGPDDILFIDSSHILLPGMDVDIQLNRIFPVLRPGVIVHRHDIFLPYDYPPAMLALVVLGAERSDWLDRVGLFRGGLSGALRPAGARRAGRERVRPAFPAAVAVAPGQHLAAPGRVNHGLSGRDSPRAIPPAAPRPRARPPGWPGCRPRAAPGQ